MFTKAIIEKLFKKNNGINFIIKTNEPIGRGINGVSYSTYYGLHTWKDSGYGRTNDKYASSKIVEVDDDYIVLATDTNDGWAHGTASVVIPMDTITSIKFVEQISDGFPPRIDKNDLFL